MQEAVLPTAQRLRRSTDFGAAVRAGRRAGRGALVIHLAQAEPAVEAETATRVETTVQAGDGHDIMTIKPAQTAAGAYPPARAGFVVSKAIGNAVTRNLVRRRLRHLVRERLEHLPPGSTLVVRALPGAADQSYARLGADLDAALAAARAPRPRRGRRA